MAFGRKLYSITEIYSNVYKGIKSWGGSLGTTPDNLVDKQFKERLMLAVTEVNNCEMCSYAHTKAALNAGISNEEIKKLLTGNLSSTPDNEVKAIMFAQNYAEKRGNPDSDTWITLVKEYGIEKSFEILKIIRMIMIGNSLGIPMGSFKSRFKGTPDSRSSLGYELSVFITIIPIFLIAILAAIVSIIRDKVFSD